LLIVCNYDEANSLMQRWRINKASYWHPITNTFAMLL